MVMPREVGIWGGTGGTPFDDGVFSAVKQVILRLGDSSNLVHAVQFEYIKRDGKSIWSQRHGGPGGDIIKRITFDVSSEYLIGISGYYGPVEGCDGLEAIKSISLHSNKMMYGPFGRETGAVCTYFASTASPGKIVGFHGRSNAQFFTAIGVHMEYFEAAGY